MLKSDVPVTMIKGLSATLRAGPKLLGPRNMPDSTASLHNVHCAESEPQKYRTLPWFSANDNSNYNNHNHTHNHNHNHSKLNLYSVISACP